MIPSYRYNSSSSLKQGSCELRLCAVELYVFGIAFLAFDFQSIKRVLCEGLVGSFADTGHEG